MRCGLRFPRAQQRGPALSPCPSPSRARAGGRATPRGTTATDLGTKQGLFEAYTPPEGYWTDASDGGIFTYGNAVFHGSMGGQHLNAPMVGMAQTPGPGGYWEVASDGGIFSFGNATFHGSTGGLHLNKPVVGMAATPDGGGYWLVASDGGIFNYGDAGFYGSAGSIPLNKPIVGHGGHPRRPRLLAGGLRRGDLHLRRRRLLRLTRAASPLNKPIVGMAADASGLGYWLVASDGGIFTYGDAGFHGSAGRMMLNEPVVGHEQLRRRRGLLAGGVRRRDLQLRRRRVPRLGREPAPQRAIVGGTPT